MPFAFAPFFEKKRNIKKFIFANSGLQPSRGKNAENSTKSARSATNRQKNVDPAYLPSSNGTSANSQNAENHEKNLKNGKLKKRKESTESRARKFSNDDLLSPETPLIGCNFKDFINEDKFNKLGVHIQVT